MPVADAFRHMIGYDLIYAEFLINPSCEALATEGKK
jgi:hypothetical protein